MSRPLAAAVLAAPALLLAACDDRGGARRPATGPLGAAVETIDPGADNLAAYAPVLPAQVAAQGRVPSSDRAVNGYWPDGRPISAWTAAETPAGRLPPLPGR